MQASPQRPIEIRHHTLTAGETTVVFRPGDDDHLLKTYLVLVRSLRHQRRDREITLRRVDIDVMAAHLAIEPADVVARLADLMGATRTQRAAMLSLLATGALVIGLGGSVAASPRPAPASPHREPDPPIVQVVPVELDAPTTTVTTTTTTPTIPTAPATAGAPTTTDAPIGPPATPVPTVAVATTVASPASAPPAPPDRSETGVISGPDGDEVVAVAPPPVPPPQVVPTPAPSEPAVDESGAMVAVGAAPVPAAPSSDAAPPVP